MCSFDTYACLRGRHTGICHLRLTNVRHGKFKTFKNDHKLLKNNSINKILRYGLDNILTFKFHKGRIHSNILKITE